MISLTDIFDAALRRHNDVILLPAIRRVSGNDFVPEGQWTGTLRRARATVELLRQKMPNFLAPNLWPPNSPALSRQFCGLRDMGCHAPKLIILGTKNILFSGGGPAPPPHPIPLDAYAPLY